MRLFIAADLPQEVKDELASLQKLLPAAKMSLAHDFHLTLKFLGEVTPAKAEVVKQLLGSVRLKPFTATTSGIGIFPSESYIRVVWAGIEPESEMARLQKQVDDALEKEFPREKGFKSHITLTRIKFVDNKRQFLQQLQKIEVKKIEFNVDSFKLKRSTLTKEGAVYEDIAVFGKGL